jgi:hypothetical protein
MRLNFELNLFVHAPHEAARLREFLEAEFEQSRQIAYREFAHRPLRQRLREAAFRPLAPLL